MLTVSPSPELEMTVIDAMSADVERGLKLYGLATKEMNTENAARRAKSWASVFQKNDVGPGLFVAAKYKGDFVGFVALIDFEMLVGGVPIRAGKAEFWVVAQNAQKIEVAGSGTRLPWALFSFIREQAENYGYRAILTVSPKAARRLRRAGDICVSPSLASFVAPKDLGMGRVGQRLGRLLHRKRLGAISSHFLAIAGERVHRVKEVQELDVQVGYGSPNALISSSKAMIRARFPSPRYLKYVLDRPGQAPLLFVFDRPTEGHPVRLMHWSGLPESPEEFAAVLGVTMNEMQKANASKLFVEISVEQFPAHYRLGEMGFSRSSRCLEDCYLMDVNGSAGLASVQAWQITHGHMGFYSYLA